jgi:hypothetical protein
MIISINKGKSIYKIYHPFMIKALKKLEVEGTYLNIIKAIYYKTIVTCILKGEKTEVISP